MGCGWWVPSFFCSKSFSDGLHGIGRIGSGRFDQKHQTDPIGWIDRTYCIDQMLRSFVSVATVGSDGSVGSSRSNGSTADFEISDPTFSVPFLSYFFEYIFLKKIVSPTDPPRTGPAPLTVMLIHVS